MRAWALLIGLLVAGEAHAKKPKAGPSAAPAAAEAEKPAPKVPRLSKIPVGTCGCALYAPEGFAFEPPTKSEDGADVWTGSTMVGEHEFAAIVVKFAQPFAADDDVEGILVSYLDFLKGQFSIVGSAGVGKGHTLESNPAAKGVIDFWKDADGADWAVKGWVDRNRLAVLLIQGKGDYPIYNVQTMYFDGFRFTE